MTRNENRGRQCLCGCRTWTYGNYAPGHDSRHVARFVRQTLHAWCDEVNPMYETTQVWKLAIDSLPTQALRNKYRDRMIRQAQSGDCHNIVAAMDDPEWQAMLRPLGDIKAVDPDVTYANPPTHWVAVIATAMGMSRSALNRRHS